MSRLTLFYLNGCPYCRNADKAIDELIAENPEYKNIIIEKINETKNPEIADRYDYYYVPTIFSGDIKLYEAHPGESYADCKKELKRIFDEILN